MLRPLAACLFLIGLSACNVDPTGDRAANGAQTAPADTLSDEDMLLSHDPTPGGAVDAAQGDDQPRPVMQLQIVLDRLGFTPGVIDGKEGLSTRNAVLGFQEANGLPVTGGFDDQTKAALAKWSNIPATRIVTIPQGFAAGPFAKLPDQPADQAALPGLGYESLDEKLAERFHTTVETLYQLNGTPPPTPAPTSSAAPGSQAFQTTFRGGQRIRVPNVGVDRIEKGAVTDPAWAKTLATLGVGTAQPKVARIVVSKSKGTLKGFDEAGKLVAMFTATMGSQHDPLPLGNWKVLGVARNPPFHYNPKLFWDASPGDSKALLPPGPNGPVGVAWIDLNKPHYGIHGTPAPETIGRAESHGCVRLTNWDVARLAQMVGPGTKVLFEG